jgi:hypothetical protein
MVFLALWGGFLMTLGEWAAVIVTLIVGLPGIYWARAESHEFREQNRLVRLDLQNRGVETEPAKDINRVRKKPFEALSSLSNHTL